MSIQKVCYQLDNHKWYDPLPASAAVSVEDLLCTSGQVALDAESQPVATGDVAAQARYAFDNIRQVVERANGTLQDVVELMVFVKDPRDMDAIYHVARDYFETDHPAWTMVGSLGFHRSELLVSIRAIAHLGDAPKECFTPDTLKWWKNYPMSAGCKKGNLLFISGQVAADADGMIVTPGDHSGQARFAFNRFREIVAMAGGTMGDIIDLICFSRDPRGQVPVCDTWCNEFVNELPFDEVPALTAIGTTGLYQYGMMGAHRAIADLSPGKRVAKTPASIWWKITPISGGTKKEGGRVIGLAGQVASDGDGFITTPGDTEAQARYAFNRLREVLGEFGATMDNIVEVISFHKDPRAWEIVMTVGHEFFKKDEAPAWTPVGTTGLFKEGFLHEIYALAVV
ncbi:MAG: Rid family hydrolase [Nitrospinota bacterium]